MEVVRRRPVETDSKYLGLNQDLLLSGYDPSKPTNYCLIFKNFNEASLRQWVLDYIDPPEIYAKNWRSLELISEYCFNLNTLEQISGQSTVINEAHQTTPSAPATQSEVAQVVWQRMICDIAHCLFPETIDYASWQTDGQIKIPEAITNFLNNRELSIDSTIINLKLEELLGNCQTIVGHYLSEAKQHAVKLATQADYWSEIAQTTKRLIEEDVVACKLAAEINQQTPASYSDYILSLRNNSRLPHKLEQALAMTTAIASLSQEARSFVTDLQAWLKLIQRPATLDHKELATDPSATLSQADSTPEHCPEADQVLLDNLSRGLIDDWQTSQRQHADNLWQLNESLQAWNNPALQPTTLIDNQDWGKCQVYTTLDHKLANKIEADTLRQHANLRLLSYYWQVLESSLQLNSSFQLHIHHQLKQLGHLKI